MTTPSDEPLIPVARPRVRDLSAYHRVGWPGAPAISHGRVEAVRRLPGPVRELRRLLYWTMRSTGFVVIDCEWWHFEYGTRRWAALTGEPPRYGVTELADGR